MAPDISIVVPAYNEEDYLDAAVRDLVEGMGRRARAFELIVVENGSTDRTAAVAAALADALPEVRALSRRRADYGDALRAGFLAAGGDVVVNFDVDYYDLGFLDRALDLLAAGPVLVVAAKRGPGAVDTRSPARRLVTSVFSFVLRRGFGLGVGDTHGMKVMRREPLVPLVRQCRFGTDLFDTELILRAERAGHRVAELPVTVEERRASRTAIGRRIPRTVAGLGRLWLALRAERRAG